MKVNFEKTKVTVDGSKDEVFKSIIDPCAKCGRLVMSNSVMCTNCGKWVHGRCSEMKRATSTLAKGLDFEETTKEIMEPAEKLSFYDQVEFVKGFCFLRNRLNASGESKAAVTEE